MSDATDKARDAVADRAAELAVAATPETLKSIAEAVAQVHFGPEGSSSETKYEYHSTHHDGRNRPNPGFGAPEPK